MADYNSLLAQQSAMLAGLLGNSPEVAPPAAQGMPDLSWLDILQGRTPRSQPNFDPMMELNPGTTWGGRDKNAILPEDVSSARTYGLPIEGL